MKDFDTSHLHGQAKAIADRIVEWMMTRYGEEPRGGGCKAFYSIQEWKDRGELYGRDSLLILCYDGGDLAPLCNWAYGARKETEAFRDFMTGLGVWVEPCTGWYSAVYPL